MLRARKSKLAHAAEQCLASTYRILLHHQHQYQHQNQNQQRQFGPPVVTTVDSSVSSGAVSSSGNTGTDSGCESDICSASEENSAPSMRLADWLSDQLSVSAQAVARAGLYSP